MKRERQSDMRRKGREREKDMWTEKIRKGMEREKYMWKE